MSNVWAVIPVKRFSQSKKRLATILTEQERIRLCAAMMADTLDVLAGNADIAGTIVVTDDPLARSIARSHALTLLEDPGNGLNVAIKFGMQRLEADGASAGVVVPIDIPYIKNGEISQLVRLLEQCSAVITPAEADGGTNLLAVQLPTSLTFSYGPESFASHVAQMETLHIDHRICRLSGAAIDIDRPEDLLTITHADASDNRTGAFIRKLDLARRMQKLRA